MIDLRLICRGLCTVLRSKLKMQRKRERYSQLSACRVRNFSVSTIETCKITACVVKLMVSDIRRSNEPAKLEHSV